MQPLDLATSLLVLKKIRDNCENKVLQQCLFESVHKNKVIPVITYYYLHKLEEVDKLNTFLTNKNLKDYINVLEKLTTTLINIFG